MKTLPSPFLQLVDHFYDQVANVLDENGKDPEGCDAADNERQDCQPQWRWD